MTDCPQYETPLSVCCHTCHRSPGEPCQWLRDESYHPLRVRHFEVQSQKEVRDCPVCGEEAQRAWKGELIREGVRNGRNFWFEEQE